MTPLAILALVLAGLPAGLVLWNLLVLREPEGDASAAAGLVSILIPARDEEGNIGAAVEAALASRGVPVEVVVMDDGSTDRTAAIVEAAASRDHRVRLLHAPPLPEGWTGKVHACHHLAKAARGDLLLFVDADVRLFPEAARRLASAAEASGAALVSAVPRQRMASLGELLTVPMINFLLLGYLPFALMRTRPDPSLGAACGQLLLARRDAYEATGGHGAIPGVLHEGLQLARLLRRHGYATDVVKGDGLASCRMYRGFQEAWAGFAKNAHEGMATPAALPVWTCLLAGGHVLPVGLAAAALAGAAPVLPCVAALLLSLGARAAVTVATREPLLSIPLHPVAVAVALAIQWSALLRAGRRPAGWKGRLYPAT